MKTILVTGGAGYIGSHTAMQLAATGFQPVVLDDLSGGRRDFVRWGPMVEADVTNASALDAAMQAHSPDAVIHLAGLIDAADSVRQSERYRRVNVGGTKTLLEAMARHGVGTLVFSSSAAVYGAPAAASIVEDSPIAPLTPYGSTKAEAETLIAGAGVQWVSLRYFNAAGADGSGEIGEAHEPETHAVPLAIAAALGGPAFTIYGADYATPDGTAVRDYIHVSDLAAAHTRALAYLGGGGASIALNVGSGRGTSVRSLVAAVRRVGGAPVPIREGARRTGDAPRLVADIGAAKRRLGWKPLRSDIDTIVSTAWNWHRRREPKP